MKEEYGKCRSFSFSSCPPVAFPLRSAFFPWPALFPPHSMMDLEDIEVEATAVAEDLPNFRLHSSEFDEEIPAESPQRYLSF